MLEYFSKDKKEVIKELINQYDNITLLYKICSDSIMKSPTGEIRKVVKRDTQEPKSLYIINKNNFSNEQLEIIKEYLINLKQIVIWTGEKREIINLF